MDAGGATALGVTNSSTTPAKVGPAGASTFTMSSPSASARVGPTLRIATGIPRRQASRTCRNAEWTARDDPTTNRPSAWLTASRIWETRCFGTVLQKKKNRNR